MALEPSSFEVKQPSAVLAAAVKRAVELVSFMVQAIDQARVDELRLPGNVVQFGEPRDAPAEIAEARVAAREWVIGAGLQLCVDAIDETLEWARVQAALWGLPGRVHRLDDGRLHLEATTTGATWLQEFGPAGVGYRWETMGLKDKIAKLKAVYDLAPPELTGDILTLNAARNCLVHRRGIVGPRDLTAAGDTAIVVRWRRFGLTVEDGAGSRPIGIGDVVEEGGVVRIAFEPMERAFAVGERMIFDVEDFAAMAHTFAIYGSQLVGSINAMQERRFAAEASTARRDANLPEINQGVAGPWSAPRT